MKLTVGTLGRARQLGCAVTALALVTGLIVGGARPVLAAAIAPSQPRNVAASVTSQTWTSVTLKVTWKAPTSNGGSPITGYRANVATLGSHCNVKVLHCNLSGFVRGQTYTIYVWAINSVGVSVPAVLTYTVATAPGVPTNVSATLISPAGQAPATVRISWQAPVNDGGSAVSGYEAQLQGTGALCMTTSKLSCDFSNLTPRASYTWQVTATNQMGSGPVALFTYRVPSLPGPPTGLSGQVQSGDATTATVNFTWTPPADDGGAPIAYYSVHVTPAVTIPIVTGLPKCDVDGMTRGAKYTIVVQSVSSFGSSTAASLTYTVPLQGQATTKPTQSQRPTASSGSSQHVSGSPAASTSVSPSASAQASPTPTETATASAAPSEQPSPAGGLTSSQSTSSGSPLPLVIVLVVLALTAVTGILSWLRRRH